jgi:hypothetical protein
MTKLTPWLCAALLTLVSSPAILASGYPTIVGEWYDEVSGPTDCGTQFTWRIRPMGLGTDEMQCTFKDVARDGWEVTWHGRCSGGHPWRDNFKQTVRATERRGELTIAWVEDGTYLDGLRRCPK